jgi:hypothetical protein
MKKKSLKKQFLIKKNITQHDDEWGMMMKIKI